MSESGAVTAFGSPVTASCQVVFIDRESLPTGIDTPSAGQSSIPTACTVSKSEASSPGCPAAHIQFAESFTSPILSIDAAAMFVIASPTAMRPDAGPSINAAGVLSPIAIASPRKVAYPIVVTAQSATGTCQGPTIWSRAHIPPTDRSPIVTRKVLSATAGSRSTR